MSCGQSLRMMKPEELQVSLLFYCSVGHFFYANVEHFTYLDALYFSFTTLTTIGYGDIYPVTAAEKIFTMMYSVVGLGVMGSFLAVVVKKLGQLDKKK